MSEMKSKAPSEANCNAVSRPIPLDISTVSIASSGYEIEGKLRWASSSDHDRDLRSCTSDDANLSVSRLVHHPLYKPRTLFCSLSLPVAILS